MTIQTSLGRRRFIASGAAVAGGFSLGFSFPYASAQATEVQEINAWVVIHPDDKVVIRIARSEMGQGTLTGLAQLVAEELECDWSKVTTEYPTPGENLRRGRVWKKIIAKDEPDDEGQTYEVRYEPAESDSGMFGGNSNWRGPVWFPMNLVNAAVLTAEIQYISPVEGTADALTAMGGEAAKLVDNPLVNPTDEFLAQLSIFGPLSESEEVKFDKRFSEITGTG